MLGSTLTTSPMNVAESPNDIRTIMTQVTLTVIFARFLIFKTEHIDISDIESTQNTNMDTSG